MGYTKRSGIALLFLFCVPVAFANDTFTKGYQAYSDGNTEEAAALWQEAAAERDPRAMTFLAILHARGDSIEWDYMRSNIWLESAFSVLDERSRARVLEQLHEEWVVSEDLDLGWLVASAYRKGLVDAVFIPAFEDNEVTEQIKESIAALGSTGVSYQKELYMRWVAYLGAKGHLQSQYEWIKAKQKLRIQQNTAEALVELMLKGHLPSGKLAYQLHYNSPDLATRMTACAAKLVIDSYAVRQRAFKSCDDKEIKDTATSLYEIYNERIGRAKRIYTNNVPTDVLVNAASGA